LRGRGTHIGLLVGKPEGEKLLGRPRRRWVDNVKIYLREIEWVGMDWIVLAQDKGKRNAVMDIQVS
jgi:hypothetical protein